MTRDLLVTWLILCSCSVCFSQEGLGGKIIQVDPEKVRLESLKEAQEITATQFRFSEFMDNSDEIVSVEYAIYSKENIFGAVKTDGPVYRLKRNADNFEILKGIATTFNCNMPRPQVWYSGSLPTGHIKFIKRKSDCTIYTYKRYFCFSENSPTSQTCFTSYPLACLVNAIYKSSTKEDLSQEEFERLSGDHDDKKIKEHFNKDGTVNKEKE